MSCWEEGVRGLFGKGRLSGGDLVGFWGGGVLCLVLANCFHDFFSDFCSWQEELWQEGVGEKR